MLQSNLIQIISSASMQGNNLNQSFIHPIHSSLNSREIIFNLEKALLFGVVTARQCRECFIKKSVLHLFTPFYFKLWIPNCQVVVVSYVGVSWRKFSKKTGWLGSNVETVLGGFSKMSKEIINGKFHKKDHCKSRYAHFISSDTKIP